MTVLNDDNNSKEDSQKKIFSTFEVAKLTQKFIFAVLGHITKEGSSCNHTIQDVLSNILMEKVREYLVGEDLVAAQDREIEELLRKQAASPDPVLFDKGSLSMEEAEEQARKGQEPDFMLFKRATETQKLWDTIQKHLDEGREGGGKCQHTLKEILYDIPLFQEAMKEI